MLRSARIPVDCGGHGGQQKWSVVLLMISGSFHMMHDTPQTISVLVLVHRLMGTLIKGIRCPHFRECDGYHQHKWQL